MEIGAGMKVMTSLLIGSCLTYRNKNKIFIMLFIVFTIMWSLPTRAHKLKTFSMPHIAGY